MGEKLACSFILAGENQPKVIVQLHGESWPTIEKVPAILRKVKANSGCFDPLVVAIGPYHRGKPELELMQQHKETMARQYANEDLNTSLEDLYQKVSPLAIDARECYTYKEEVDKFNDKEFIEMMVLDTCFILHFIDCVVNGKLKDLKMKSNKIAFVQRDLLLLENQIPFKVLNEILGNKFGDEKQKMETLCKFVAKIPPEETKMTTIQKSFSGFPFWGKKYVQDGRDKAKPFDGKPAHLLDVMRRNLVDEFDWPEDTDFWRSHSYWFSFRSAQELKAKGIHFRLSKTKKFTDVEFRNWCYFSGYLYLPQLCIDDSTKSMLLNMVAHESSTDGPDDVGVSSYIWFMDSLVDNAEDVKELRKNGILLNYLGSDQKVADLFNEISDHLVPHPHAYAKVKTSLDEHYKSKLKTWLAECWHTHFTSPWTIIAFVGAILALVMSFIQTYESVKPST